MRTVTACPACGSGSLRVVVSLDTDDRRDRFLQFSRIKYGGLLDDAERTIPPVIDRCNECGHCWYANQPEPDQLQRMYAAGRPLCAGTQPSREPTETMAAEMSRLRRLVDGGDRPTLLDFGSGYGRWARAAVAAGFVVTAFEPSAARGAEDQVPFELAHTLEALQGRRYVAIQLEQVLEHVTDPLAVLQDLRAYCSADTVIRITVPNLLRAPEGEALWSSWPFDGRTAHTMAPFEHLHGFTPGSLRRLLARAGFKPIAAARLLRHYPSVPVRSLLSRVRPSLGTTLSLVRLADR